MAIQISFDISDAQSASQQFADIVRKMSTNVGDFTVKMVEFNEKGVAFKGVIEQMDSAGRKVQTTFEDIGQGFARAGQKIVESSNQAKIALQQLQTQAGKIGGDTARQIFPLPSAATISQIQRYNNEIANLQRNVAAAGLNANQVSQMFQAAAQGPAQFAQSLSSLPPQMQAVGQSILSVASIAQQAGVTGAAAGNAFGVSWQNLLRILEVQLFRRAVTTTITLLSDGIRAAIDYQIQLQQVANVTGQTAPAQFERMQSAVRGLSEEFGVASSDVLKNFQATVTTQAGDAAAGLEVLRNAMVLSQAAGTDLDATVKLLNSTLQTFGLTAEQSGRVASVFFSTAQRSRIPLEETQAAIGRVSQNARALGISFEEVVALFNTIASQGGRPTESFALLNQVLGRLIIPTKHMQEFLDSLGTSSGRTAIQTYGLIGVLEKLNQAIAESPEKLGETAGSIRTFRAEAAVTGDMTAKFVEELTKLRNVDISEKFTAAGKVAVTAAQQLRDQFQVLRNAFTQDFGTRIIGTFVDFTNAMGGAKVAVGAFVDTLKTIAGAFATFYLATRFVGPVFNALFSALETARSGFIGLQSTLAGAGAGFRAFFSSLLSFGSLTTIVFLIDQIRRGINAANEAARVEAIQQRIANIEKQARESSERVRQAADQAAGRTNAALAEFFKPLQERAAMAVRASKDARDEIIHHQGEIASAFRVQAQSFLDGIRNLVNAARANIREAQADIKNSQKDFETFRQRSEQRTFRTRLGFEEDPLQAIALINQRRAAVLQQVQAAFASGDRDRIEAARRAFDELQSLNDDITRREVDDQRRRQELSGFIPTEIRYGQEVRVFHANLTASMQREAELVELRRKLEEQFQATAKQREEQSKRQLEIELSNLRTFEQLLKQAQEFRAFTASGRLLPEFQKLEDRTKGAGLAAALKRFDELATEIKDAAQKRGVDTTQIEALLKARRKAIVDQQAAEQDVAATETRLTDLGTRLTTMQRDRTELAEQQARAQNEITAAIARSGTFLGGREISLSPLETPIIVDRNLDGIRAKYRDILKLIEEANAAQRTATVTPNIENVNSLEAALEKVRRKAAEIEAEARRLGDTPLTENQTKAIHNLAESLPAIQTGLSRLTVPEGEFGIIERTRQQIAEMDAAIVRVTTSLRGPGGAIEAIRSFSTVDFTPMINAFRTLEGMIGPVGTISRGFAAISAATPPPPPVRLPGPAAPPGMRWVVDHYEYMAQGGSVGPRGTDIIPAWLSPGEFVMPARQTQQYFTQLVSMLHGTAPRYYAGGGPVSVGDIHVHVTGQAQPEATIRNIAYGLKRELRRNTINF